MKKTEITKNTNYHVHDFMLELGLSSNELLVYALIYSFTKGAIGVFYGSQEYVANVVGISRRTVARIYKKLYLFKLIEKYESKEEKVKGIRALLPKKPAIKEKLYANDLDEDILPEIKREPKTIREIEQSLPQRCEKYALINIPTCDSVMLTENQYKRLRALVRDDVLYGYARRFQRYLDNRLKGMLPTPRSHYKVIKAWIEEDLG